MRRETSSLPLYARVVPIRWQQSQLLTWQGATYHRRSQAYQDLLTRAFDALATDITFQYDLPNPQRL